MHKGSTSRQRVIASTACLAILSASLAGCQTTGQSLARYNDASDRCSVHRQPLIQSQDDLNQPIVEGVVIGALATGLAVGLLTGNVRAGIGSAVAGGIAGAAVGYYNAKEKSARNQAELVAAIDTDAQRDASRFSSVGSSVRSLQNCRTQQLAELRQQVVSKRISVGDARTQRDKIRQSIRDDGDLMNTVMGQVDSRIETYVQSRGKAVGATDVSAAVGGLDADASRMYTTRKAAVRMQANNDASVLRSLDAREPINAIGEPENGWQMVGLSDGSGGYMNTSYLSPNRPGSAKAVAKAKNGSMAAVVASSSIKAARSVGESTQTRAMQDLDSLLS